MVRGKKFTFDLPNCIRIRPMGLHGKCSVRASTRIPSVQRLATMGRKQH